jgi:hypothetical protein
MDDHSDVPTETPGRNCEPLTTQHSLDQVQPFHKAVSIAGSSLATANLILRLHRRHLSLGHRVTDWSLCSQATRTRRARLL